MSGKDKNKKYRQAVTAILTHSRLEDTAKSLDVKYVVMCKQNGATASSFWRKVLCMSVSNWRQTFKLNGQLLEKE